MEARVSGYRMERRAYVERVRSCHFKYKTTRHGVTATPFCGPWVPTTHYKDVRVPFSTDNFTFTYNGAYMGSGSSSSPERLAVTGTTATPGS